MKRLMLGALAAGAVGVVVSACATSTVAAPTGRLIASESAIRAAEEIGATTTPRAALHLKLAKDQLAQAKRALAASRYEEATMLLERADADAEVAIALSKQVVAQTEARRIQNEVYSLRQQR